MSCTYLTAEAFIKMTNSIKQPQTC